MPINNAAVKPEIQQKSLSSGHEHVIVVDDESLIRSLIKKVLTAHGHQVTDYADPTEALQQPGHGFTLAIIDQVMPGMNGMSLVKNMRRANPTLPVLLISGYIGTGDTEKILVDPLVKKLPKPFTPAELFATMAKVASGMDVEKTE